MSTLYLEKTKFENTYFPAYVNETEAIFNCVLFKFVA